MHEVLRERFVALGFGGSGGLYARRSADTWEVVQFTRPPQMQGASGQVRFIVDVHVTCHAIRRYWAAWARTDDSGPPRDSALGLSRSLEPEIDPAAGWRADSATDAVALADRIWIRFESAGLPFLLAHQSSRAVRDKLLASLDQPEPNVHALVHAAVLCKHLGPPDVFQRCLNLLTNFPTPVESWREWARDHSHMIPRLA